MVSTLYICDCCGKKVNNYKLTSCYKGLETFEGKYDDFSGTPLRQQQWELCDECYSRLKNVLAREISLMTHYPSR